MAKKQIMWGVLAASALALGVAGGCKKEESKVEAPVPAPSAHVETAAPQTAATGPFAAQITAKKTPETAKAGETLSIPVRVKNVGSEKWTRDKANPIHLSYHFKTADGKIAIWDGTRNFIPKDVLPAEETTILAKVKTPTKAGKYNLQFDMVMDTPNGGWFEKKGSQVLSVPVEIK